MVDYGWMRLAACKGQTDLFFNGSGHGTYDAARKICADCPVQFQCEEYGHIALHMEVSINRGLWGGKTTDELKADEDAGVNIPESVVYCLQCDKPMPITPRRGRPRKYCNPTCYKRYWEQHQHRSRPEGSDGHVPDAMDG